MIIFTIPFITFLLLLVSNVSGAYIPDLNRRVVGRVAGTVGRMGLNTVRTAARTGAARRVVQQAPPKVAQTSGPTAKQVTGGLFAGKIVGGALVGFGSLGAQGVDHQMQSDKRDLEPEVVDFDLERRARTLLRAGARVATSASRAAARPNVARPVLALPQAAKPPSMLTKFKGAGTVTGMGLTAGVGEYMGGKTMGNAIDRLDNRDIKKRDLEGKEELWVRNPTLVKAAGKVATAGMRAGRTNVGRTAINAVSHATTPSTIGQKAGSVVKGAGKVAGFGSAAAIGGFGEGLIQNVDIPTQQKLRADPKGTISKMLPPNPFGTTTTTTTTRREYVEELIIRELLEVD